MRNEPTAAQADEPPEVPARTPPGPEQVARRALALALAVFRGVVEADAADPASTERWREARAWFTGLGLESELTPDERRDLDAPVGALPMRTTMALVGRAEALAVLGFALGAVAPPRMLERCEPAAVAGTLGFLAEHNGTVLASPSLLRREELALWSEAYRAVWRRLQHDAQPLDPAARGLPPEVVRSLDVGPGDVRPGDVRPGDGGPGDGALDGVPLAQLGLTALEGARRVVLERRAALAWLLGETLPDVDVTGTPRA